MVRSQNVCGSVRRRTRPAPNANTSPRPRGTASGAQPAAAAQPCVTSSGQQAERRELRQPGRRAERAARDRAARDEIAASTSAATSASFVPEFATSSVNGKATHA